jgi:hypothetical protein
LTNATFEPSPTLFNAVEVWRIGRQVQQVTAHCLKQGSNATAVMKRGVIEDNNLSGFEHWHQASF